MVVFYHYVGVPNAKIGDQGKSKAIAWGTSASKIFPYDLHHFATYGWTGVELFFLISGFVICMSGWGRKPADFFVSRVVRLVPAFWAATAITVIALVSFPRLTSGVRPSVVLANLTMVQPAYGVRNLVPAYWTLFVELTFYLLFGIVAIGGITYRRMVTFCVLWSVASIAAIGSHDAGIQMIVNPKYSAYFVAGIAFFLIYKFGSNLLLWAIVGYSWLISINQPRYDPPWQVTLILTSFFVIMGLAATHRLDFIRWRWLTVAGALTYPLYLLHQDIGFTVFAYLRNDISPIKLVILTYLAMLGLSWLVYRLVERPLAPILRRKLLAAVNQVRASGPRATPVLAGIMNGHGTTPGSAPSRDPGAAREPAGSGSAARDSAGARDSARADRPVRPDTRPEGIADPDRDATVGAPQESGISR